MVSLYTVDNIVISIHALLAESDAFAWCSSVTLTLKFLSTLSLRRATANTNLHAVCGGVRISIHALLAESDASWCPYRWSTLVQADFYPRSPCGERLCLTAYCLKRLWVMYFYPRSPCGERLRLRRPESQNRSRVFLSTLSLRRATNQDAKIDQTRSSNFYPRSPCGERRLVNAFHGGDLQYFYPRSPCGERLAEVACITWRECQAFLSTLSLRRATIAGCGQRLTGPKISIHALLAESDKFKHSPSKPMRTEFLSTLSLRRATSTVCMRVVRRRYNFYPRSPCGERPRRPVPQCNGSAIFLSTLSLRRATRANGSTARRT